MKSLAIRTIATLLTLIVGVAADTGWRFVQKLKTERPGLRTSFQISPLEVNVPNIPELQEPEAGHHSPFDPSGEYQLGDPYTEGTFKFVQFDMKARRRKGKLSVSGQVKTVGQRFKFASTSVTPERLSFTTVAVKGVRFSFEGRFLGKGKFSDYIEREGFGVFLLEGTLRKFINDVQVDEIDTPFAYYLGC